MRRSILPDHHYEHDRHWIEEQLSSLKPGIRRHAAENYSRVYRETFDAEEISYRKINSARFAANSRLRIYVAAQRSAAVDTHNGADVDASI